MNTKQLLLLGLAILLVANASALNLKTSKNLAQLSQDVSADQDDDVSGESDPNAPLDVTVVPFEDDEDDEVESSPSDEDDEDEDSTPAV